jgi:dCTP deaminase
MSCTTESSTSAAAAEADSFTDQRMSLLSNKAIRRHMTNGTIVIEPFREENLATSSYDVTLGPYFYRESPLEAGMGIYNPYSSSMVDRVWGKPLIAELASCFTARTGYVWKL